MKPIHYLSDRDKQIIKRCQVDGLSLRQAAAEFNVTHTAVYKILLKSDRRKIFELTNEHKPWAFGFSRSAVFCLYNAFNGHDYSLTDVIDFITDFDVSPAIKKNITDSIDQYNQEILD